MDKFALSLTQAMAGDEWPLQFLLQQASPAYLRLSPFAGRIF